MKNPAYETMTYWGSPDGYTVRVWREEQQLSRGPDVEVISKVLSSWPWGYKNDNDIFNFIKTIAKLPRIAAIEVLDPNKNGTLFYPDWK